jgi:signal transduction histidine kinase
VTQAETKTKLEREHFAETLEVLDRGARLLEEAYRELWQSRESERSERELSRGEALRDLCHEIKNPLAGVRGLVALVERELEPGTKALRLIEGIKDGLDALDSLLTRRTLAEEEETDAGSVAEEACGLTLAEGRAAGKDLRFRIDAPAGIELPVSSADFRSIVFNLVRNAAEACERYGTVTVRLESTLDALTLSVQDDGRGLPSVSDAEMCRRGFSTKAKGRGIGLALVSELVERAGGTITFTRLVPGTVARVELPRSGR